VWRAEILKLPVVLLFVTAWVLGGTALLWAGGRFIARLPKATFRRSLVARLCHAIAAWVILGLVRLLYASVGLARLHPGVMEAFLISAVTILAFWLIVDWAFDTSIGKAALAWLPMAGELYVLLLLTLMLPDLPFWG
jgi:hypothetical protein